MPSAINHEALRRIHLFHNLSEDELAEVARHLTIKHLPEKTLVFLQGEPLSAIYLILQGKVKIHRNDDQGREQVVNLLQEGDMFPHLGIYPDAEYPAHAQMIEEGTLLVLPTVPFRRLLETSPTLCLNLMSVMEHRIRELHQRLAEMVMHDTFGRVVLLLIRLARLHGRPEGDQVRINLPLTHQEIAQMIGTSRETVSRTITQLKKAGALMTTPEHCLLVDLDRLEQQLL
jgi:CRP/FNR family cyclic AMP-dependent transcriptional regulator